MKPEDKLDAAIAAAGGPAAVLRVVGAVEDAPARAARMSELDLADVWVSRDGDRWRYVKEWDQWFEWRDGGWFVDGTSGVRASVMDLLRESGNWAEAQGMTASQKRQLCSAKTVSSVVSLAAAHRAVAMPSDLWDADTMLLGVPGGLVDLKTGDLCVAERTDYITKRCAVAPKRGTPRLWLDHLLRIFQGDAELISFSRRWLGYCLTGETGEHAMLMGIGTGANGKSAMFDTVAGIMGGYTYAAPINLLMESHQERHPTELAMLQGARLLMCSEPPQGARWDDGRLRSLTGDKTVTARRMNRDLSTFTVTHKLNVMGNHMPVLRSVDEAMRRRINVLQFGYTIPVSERDPHFLDKMRAEWPQILNWMIEGCLDWQDIGLARPESLVLNTSEYLEDENTMAQFIDECTDRGPEKFDTLASLFRAYVNWCDKQGEKPLSRKSFKAQLRETPGVGRNRVAGNAVQGMSVKHSVSFASAAPSSWMQD